MSDSSSKLNFLYPQLLKPLGDNAIASIDPLSFFPGGIPEYIAPKQANFADYPFFRKNRSFKLDTAINTKEEDNFRDSTYRVQRTSQDPTINLKSNIRSNLSSDFADIQNIDLQQSIVPAVENSIENKTIFPKQETISNVHNVDEGQSIIPVAEDSTTEEETVAPKLDEDVTNRDRAFTVSKPEDTSNLFNVDVRQQPVTPAVVEETVQEKNTAPITSYLDTTQQQPITTAVEEETVTSKLDKNATNSDRSILSLKPETNSNLPDVNNRQSIVPITGDLAIEDKSVLPIAPKSNIARQQPITPIVRKSIVKNTTFAPKLDLVTSDREAIASRQNKLLNDLFPSNKVITPSIEHPVINQETISPKLNNLLGLSSIQNQNYAVKNKFNFVNNKIAYSNFNSIARKIISPVEIKHNEGYKQDKTVETANIDRPVDSFSFVNLSPTYSVDISENNSAAQNKESIAENKPLQSTDVSLSNSQKNDSIVRKKESSIPDRWSNISELIDESTSNDNKLSTKLENNINPDRKSVPKKNSSIDKSYGMTSLRQNNLSFNKHLKTEQSKYHNHISFPSVQKRESIGYEPNTEKIRLATDNSKSSADRYQISNYQTNLVEKILTKKPLVEESSDLNSSLTQDILPENQHTQTKENEEENIEILAEEIYYLLQQRLEIERERQGQYYI